MENERKDIKYYAQRNIKLENLIHFVNKETLKEQHRKQQSSTTGTTAQAIEWHSIKQKAKQDHKNFKQKRYSLCC